MTELTAYTADEVRDMLLQYLVHIARYWANLPDVDEATGHTRTVQDRCEGVLFSVLTTLDGASMDLPCFDLHAMPHPEDKAFLQSEGERWFEPGTVISDMLHEHLWRFMEMTRHPLDGNAIAADAHYGREEPEMRECGQCDGTGTYLRDEHDTGRPCHVCAGSGEVPVDRQEPDDDYEYERRRDSLADRG